MADKLSVQNALTQLLKENKSILKNGQTLIDALFERADMSFVDRKIYEKAFVDANIGEIFLIETIETANEQAYSKLKRIMQETRALDVLETVSTALHNANNSKQGEDAAETGTNGKQGTDGGQNDGQDGGNGHDEVLKDMEPPHPPPVLTANDYYNNGVKAIGEENFSEAMAAFNKAIELSPTHEKAYGMRAMLHAKNGEYNDAIADYGKVISYNSNNSSAYRNMGMCYYALKDYKAALADFDKVLQLNPDDAEIAAMKQKILDIIEPPKKPKSEPVPTKKSELKSEKTANPHLPPDDGRNNASNIKSKEEEQQREQNYMIVGVLFLVGIFLLYFFITSSNTSYVSSNTQSNVRNTASKQESYEKKDQKLDAQKKSASAATKKEDIASQHKQRAKDYYSAKKYDNAIKECTALLEISPDELDEIYENRALIYYKKKDFLRAVDDFTQAIAHTSPQKKIYFYEMIYNTSALYSQRGWCYHCMGNYDKAIEDYTQALSINRDNYFALSKRCYAYRAIGEEEKANIDFKNNETRYGTAKNWGLVTVGLDDPFKAW